MSNRMSDLRGTWVRWAWTGRPNVFVRAFMHVHTHTHTVYSPQNASCHDGEIFCGAWSPQGWCRGPARNSSWAARPAQAIMPYQVLLFTQPWGKHHCAWGTMNTNWTGFRTVICSIPSPSGIAVFHLGSSFCIVSSCPDATWPSCSTGVLSAPLSLGKLSLLSTLHVRSPGACEFMNGRVSLRLLAFPPASASPLMVHVSF